MPAAVLPEHELAFGNSDHVRVDYLVGGALLQEAVLVDARFMREGVLAHQRFVGLRPEGNGLRQKLAGGVDLLRHDLGFKRQAAVAGFLNPPHFSPDRPSPPPLHTPTYTSSLLAPPP